MGEESLEGTVTRLLHDVNDGAPGAFDELLRGVQAELKIIAHAHLRREDTGCTMCATELVDELVGKFVILGTIEWRDRKHFFGAASKTIQRILVDHARKKKARKRIPAGKLVELPDQLPGPGEDDPMDHVKLDEALQELAALDERQSQVVMLRYYGGLTELEVAELLGVCARTVSGDWAMARWWLKKRLNV